MHRCITNSSLVLFSYFIPGCCFYSYTLVIVQAKWIMVIWYHENDNYLFDIIYSLLLSHILSSLPCSAVFVRHIDSLVTSYCWNNQKKLTQYQEEIWEMSAKTCVYVCVYVSRCVYVCMCTFVCVRLCVCMRVCALVSIRY